jgi:hypothetical protein
MACDVIMQPPYLESLSESNYKQRGVTKLYYLGKGQ